MIRGSVGRARKRGVGSGSAFTLPEALWTGSAMALEKAESEAFRKLAPRPSICSFQLFDHLFISVI